MTIPSSLRPRYNSCECQKTQEVLLNNVHYNINNIIFVDDNNNMNMNNILSVSIIL